MALILVAAGVAMVVPFAERELGNLPSFMPAMLALVVCLDVISAVLLVAQFRDSGDRRALVLSTAYVFSLVVSLGFSAAFPGVMGSVGPLGGWPSTAPWLWAAWHTGFPVLLAASVAPWPRRWCAPVPPRDRQGQARTALVLATLGGALLVLAASLGQGVLPALIVGTDTSTLTRLVGPYVVTVVALAALVALYGSRRLDGPVRWAVVGTVAVLGDAVLTLDSRVRFSIGWYVGRSLMVLASAIVLVAMLSEFRRLRGKLRVETVRLAALLERSEELEALHSTLLDLMSDGVMLRDPDGRVLAHNAAVEALLGLTADQVLGRSGLPSGWVVVRADGSPWPHENLPGQVAVATGAPQHRQVLGVLSSEGERRWLRVSTLLTRDSESGQVLYAVTSLADETAKHEARLDAVQTKDATISRTQAVLEGGGPQIVVQPIIDLRTLEVVGVEALSRFPGSLGLSPDRWFADALTVGMGTELELAAVSKAFGLMGALPHRCYLSVNLSPEAATSAALSELLAGAGLDLSNVVLELTEHADVSDYPALLEALAPLRVQGVKIAVDDAGSGFASLSHILHLRPDIVKLDIALVRGIHHDPARRALVSGLLTFATEIGACLVAEGIETADELAALRQIGVTHGQGYLLGRPGPVLELALAFPTR